MGCEIAESSWLTDSTKIVAGAEDTSASDATELKWELDEGVFIVLFHFQLISSGAQLGWSGI